MSAQPGARSDLSQCELTVIGAEKIVLFCLPCDTFIGEDVSYLDEAILVWCGHVLTAHPLTGSRKPSRYR